MAEISNNGQCSWLDSIPHSRNNSSNRSWTPQIARVHLVFHLAENQSLPTCDSFANRRRMQVTTLLACRQKIALDEFFVGLVIILVEIVQQNVQAGCSRKLSALELYSHRMFWPCFEFQATTCTFDAAVKQGIAGVNCKGHHPAGAFAAARQCPVTRRREVNHLYRPRAEKSIRHRKVEQVKLYCFATLLARLPPRTHLPQRRLTIFLHFSSSQKKNGLCKTFYRQGVEIASSRA